MTVRLLLTLAALAMVHAAPASAQRAGDARLPTWELQSHLVEGNLTTRVIRAFAFCTVRLRSREAEALLASEPYSAAEREATAAVVAGENHPCLYRTRRMTIRSPALLRGYLAEFLYARDRRRPRSAEALAADVPRIAWPADGESDVRSRERVGRHVAHCAVLREPSLAHQLLGYNHNSPGELRMLDALRPSFLSCLPDGQALRVSRLAIRAYLAEALYQASRMYTERFVNA